VAPWGTRGAEEDKVAARGTSAVEQSEVWVGLA
jgi:hypothetical protein